MTPRENLDVLTSRLGEAHLPDADRSTLELARSAEYLRRRGARDAHDEPADPDVAAMRIDGGAIDPYGGRAWW